MRKHLQHHTLQQTEIASKMRSTLQKKSNSTLVTAYACAQQASAVGTPRQDLRMCFGMKTRLLSEQSSNGDMACLCVLTAKKRTCSLMLLAPPSHLTGLLAVQQLPCHRSWSRLLLAGGPVITALLHQLSGPPHGGQGMNIQFCSMPVLELSASTNLSCPQFPRLRSLESSNTIGSSTIQYMSVARIGISPLKVWDGGLQRALPTNISNSSSSSRSLEST
mmetsp:Transcript_62925/g.159285  ORF Transcript_62925/g.159285 Transcript_62925/m.159285 type:complete len:220 (+) Transcript_62925:1409-2068(+)